jgi:hypothetical protein
MQLRSINGITLFFNPSDVDTAQVISETVEKVLHINQKDWGFEKPPACSIYIMTSWWGFFYQSAPWPWRILLTSSFPFWAFRARRTWPYSAAWTQRFGRQVAIGIKPPRLLEVSDKSIGRLMFVEEKDTMTKLRHLTCHELTHACSTHFKLPAWLNEGLAAVTVDRFLEKRTIRADTLALLRSFIPRVSPPTYRELSRLSADAIAYYSILGYWLVRYLEELRPGFLKRLFSTPPISRNIELEVAAELGAEQDGFWCKIPGIIGTHFETKEKGIRDE